MQFGTLKRSAYNFFVCGPKSSNFFLCNVGVVVVDQLLFRFSIRGSVPEIFAIKIDGCQKSRRILDVFCPPNFRGGPCPKGVPTLTPLPRGTSRGKVSWRYSHSPTSAKVISAHTLNFKPNFTCSPLNFFLGGRGPPFPLGVCAIKPWSICSVC